MSYVDHKYYTETFGGSIISAENALRSFQKASDTVDTLTYCRIVSRGLEGLTGFQQRIVKSVVCSLAEWQTENADILNSPYSSYSINGVTASWGTGAGVKKICGVFIPSHLYAELVKTGLCYAGV
jgi:hypothetical protein